MSHQSSVIKDFLQLWWGRYLVCRPPVIMVGAGSPMFPIPIRNLANPPQFDRNLTVVDPTQSDLPQGKIEQYHHFKQQPQQHLLPQIET
jgi:hypothetical protein